MGIDKEKLLAIIKSIAVRMEREKDFLTQLDNEIGDGDHGINLARGFNAVMDKMPQLEEKDIGGILKGVGMALVSNVGGASGPLYGTAFMKAGAAAAGATELDAPTLAKAMKAAIDGIMQRGKSKEGEKTMLDALCPAYQTLTTEIDAGSDLKTALEKAVAAAEKGVEYTKTIIATKGRASYLGERSLGHQDPGATSALYMLQTIADEI